MRPALFLVFTLSFFSTFAQHISDFNSLSAGRDQGFHIPPTHSFQVLVRSGELLSNDSIMPPRFDFTGYVPIAGSSSNGYLSVSSEDVPGAVTIFQVKKDTTTDFWSLDSAKSVDFTLVGGTARNCSGSITPWNTVITCEEYVSGDDNSDGYNDLGWAIEIDPETASIVDHPGGLSGADKLWALGNFKHENLVVHGNERTVYQGVDNYPGYLFKFVADVAQDLSSGQLYVYKGSKSGSGSWILLKNSTPAEQNSVLAQCADTSATIFSGIEDVEISPIDGMVYLSVKNENRVYRFTDSDPISGTSVPLFETFVGGTSYPILLKPNFGLVAWGTGNDNLAFDDLGNLWVYQDGDDHYIWVVSKDHTQTNPSVRIFAQTPFGSEPTGITFSPDFKYLFMSIQHPDPTNLLFQEDAFGKLWAFDKDAAMVISRIEYLSDINSVNPKTLELRFVPNPCQTEFRILTNRTGIESIDLFDVSGRKVDAPFSQNQMTVHTNSINPGMYFVLIQFEDGTICCERIEKL